MYGVILYKKVSLLLIYLIQFFKFLNVLVILYGQKQK